MSVSCVETCLRGNYPSWVFAIARGDAGKGFSTPCGNFFLAGTEAGGGLRFRIGRSVLALLALLWTVALAPAALALPFTYDGFDYAAGSLSGENGGIGDWKDQWAGDVGIVVVAPGGLAYTDVLGGMLDVAGNHVELSGSFGSPKQATRPLNTQLGTGSETVWLSLILDGSTASEINNISLGDGLFIGQGGKVTGALTWQLGDPDGLVADTGILASELAFLVARIDFTAGREDAWLWVDPLLGAEPDIATADASGSAKEFAAAFVRMRLESNTFGALDEIRIGSTFAEVTPFTVTPEPNTGLLVGLGLIGLGAYRRRPSRRAHR